MHSDNISIYLISLPEDQERRKSIKKQFQSTYIFFNFFRAIDLREKSTTKDTENIPRARHPNMTGAEIGCSMSHKSVMENFLKTGKEYCLILEDDIIGNDSDIKNSIELLPLLTDGSIAFLGGLQGLKNKKYIYGKKVADFPTQEVFELYSPCRFFLARTCCYLITKSAAKKILKKQENMLTRADQWDELLDNIGKIYYSDLFAHPTDLTLSHIEKERKTTAGSFFQKLKNDGLYKSMKRCTLKLYLTIVLKRLGYASITQN